MADDVFNSLVDGKTKSIRPVSVSTGVAEAGKVIKTDAAGKIDVSLLPTGVGPDTLDAPASENLSAGDYVNIWNDAGTTKLRKADNSNNRPAHGFIKASVTAPAIAKMFYEGANDSVSGKTRGARQYLGTAGASIETPLDPNVDFGPNVIHQYLGVAESPTAINTDIEDCVELT